jgi:hypothetical protein
MNVAFRTLRWLRGEPTRRLRARRTTVLMVLAFVGSTLLYLEIRSEPTDVQPVLPIFDGLPTTTISDPG